MKTRIREDFKPTNQSIKNLAKHGVLPDFIEDQLPAFITYWTETGKKKASWQMTLQVWMRRAHQGKAGREWEQNRHIRERYSGSQQPELFTYAADGLLKALREGVDPEIYDSNPVPTRIKKYRLPDPPPPGPAMKPEDAFEQLRKMRMIK